MIKNIRDINPRAVTMIRMFSYSVLPIFFDSVVSFVRHTPGQHGKNLFCSPLSPSFFFLASEILGLLKNFSIFSTVFISPIFSLKTFIAYF